MNISESMLFGSAPSGSPEFKTALAEVFGTLRHNTIVGVIERADGTIEKVAPVRNSRVDAGASFVANQISGTSVAVANYMALSANTLTIAKGDTTLSGEITTNGCARAQATYGNYTAPSALNGTASYTLTYQWTASASQTVNSVAVFNAASAGTMLVEANLSQAYNLNNGDKLTITYTFTV